MSHAEFLRLISEDDNLAAAAADGWQAADLTDRQRTLLEFADKLTCSPASMTESDLGTLRTTGLTEADVLAVVALVGFFNLANRLADALGVELDPQFTRGTPEHTALARLMRGE